MFVLRIRVTPRSVEQLKLGLAKTLPDVKSSHRAEALGRGLGFHTYASLLASSRSSERCFAEISGARFRDYLTNHGFLVDPEPLYVGAAHVAIRGVLDTIPRLHVFGIGIGRPHRTPEGSWSTPQQQYAEFLERREECLGGHAGKAFLQSLAFLASVQKTNTIRSSAGSYRLKHIAEKYECTYPEGGRLGPGYVPNGMLIAAAVHIGFKYKTYVDERGYDTLNASFNMSKPAIDDLDARIRQQSGFTQDRARQRSARAIAKRTALVYYHRFTAQGRRVKPLANPPKLVADAHPTLRERNQGGKQSRCR